MGIKIKRGLSVLCILLSALPSLISQVGPGGIGDQSTNVLWLRAGDISGITSGDTLDVPWPDTSGNAHDASQSSPAYRPFFIANAANGNPSIRFDGNNDFLDNTNSYTARTVFIIYKVSSSLQQNTI